MANHRYNSHSIDCWPGAAGRLQQQCASCCCWWVLTVTCWAKGGIQLRYFLHQYIFNATDEMQDRFSGFLEKKERVNTHFPWLFFVRFASTCRFRRIRKRGSFVFSRCSWLAASTAVLFGFLFGENVFEAIRRKKRCWPSTYSRADPLNDALKTHYEVPGQTLSFLSFGFGSNIKEKKYTSTHAIFVVSPFKNFKVLIDDHPPMLCVQYVRTIK